METELPDCKITSLASNYFNIYTERIIIRYAIKINPEPPELLFKYFRNILRPIRENLSEIYKIYLILNRKLYSITNIEEDKKFEAKYENTTYEIEIINEGILDANNINEYLNFLGRMFHTCERMLNFESVNKKYFNPKCSKELPEHGLEIWPGYTTSVNCHKNLVLVNIDMCFKILRQDTIKSFIDELLRNHSNKDDIAANVKGITAMTM